MVQVLGIGLLNAPLFNPLVARVEKNQTLVCQVHSKYIMSDNIYVTKQEIITLFPWKVLLSQNIASPSQGSCS